MVIVCGVLTGLNKGAFSGCKGLTSVTIPNSVTSISSYAFRGCTRLTSVVIPDSVTNIGGWVFDGCTKLKTIYYKGSREKWKTIEKDYSWDSNAGNYIIVYNA